ncbi:hypothetical protein CCMA1212_005522 [Trichoderma ghanense]|uniref:DUF1868 domain-containing protein n=1 Tax=Trichoderma ghanense TaxID=65468 RepID=A0ABY2H4T7_9HYPO
MCYHFPGNTIICHLPRDGQLYKALLSIHAKLQQSRFTEFYTLPPPSSWNRTVFDGVCNQRRKVGVWPKDLALDAPLYSCHGLFSEKLCKFDPDIQTPLRMAVAGIIMSKAGIRLDLAPVDAAEEKRLREPRDRLSELLEIRAKGNESYVFHLALAYSFGPGYPDIPQEFELGLPEIFYFDGMFALHRQFHLNENAGVK